jgi:hypothetical protein
MQDYLRVVIPQHGIVRRARGPLNSRVAKEEKVKDVCLADAAVNNGPGKGVATFVAEKCK